MFIITVRQFSCAFKGARKSLLVCGIIISGILQHIWKNGFAAVLDVIIRLDSTQLVGKSAAPVSGEADKGKQFRKQLGRNHLVP